MKTVIRLANCAFYGNHGALSAETELGQRFFVDAVLDVDAVEALRSDDVVETVHYGEVFATIERIVTGPPRNLIEALAHDIGAALLDEFERVNALDVTVRKPSVPIRGILDHVEVTVSLERTG